VLDSYVTIQPVAIPVADFRSARCSKPNLNHAPVRRSSVFSPAAYA